MPRARSRRARAPRQAPKRDICKKCRVPDPLGLHKSRKYCHLCHRCLDLKNLDLHVSRCVDMTSCKFCETAVQRRNLKGHIRRCEVDRGMKIKPKKRQYRLQDKFRILQQWGKLERRNGNLQEFLTKCNISKRQFDRFRAHCRAASDRFEYLTFKQLKRTVKNKDLRAVCSASGRKQTVVTPAMTEDLKAFVNANRGPPPAVASLVSGPESLDQSEDGYKMITYHSLVNRVFLKFPKEYDAVKRKDRRYRTWYERMWRWCQTHAIVLRKPNRLQPVDPIKVAQDVKRTLTEIRAIMETDGIPPGKVANLDETSLRLLAQHVRTLHHKGDKRVKAGKGTGSKLTLSIPIIWFADGSMDIVVVWKSQRKNIPMNQRWTLREGIFWFEANTKWSTKERHYQVLRQLMTLDRDIRLYLDDMASGHRGANPDKFLETMGCKRVRIPSNATWLLQPADRPTTNFRLKAMIRRILEEKQFDKKYSDFIKTAPNYLNEDAKNFVSTILAAVKKQMNGKKKLREGITQAFNETLFQPDKFHKDLKEYLDAVKDVEPAEIPGPKDGRYECPHGCGESWSRKTKKAVTAHERDCWYRRGMLMSPLLSRNQNTLEGANSTYTVGLVAETVTGDNSRQIFLGENNSFYSIGPQWYPVEEPQWWQNVGTIRYRKATQEELQIALTRSLIPQNHPELA